jgi:hypothetical protein
VAKVDLRGSIVLVSV